MFILSDYIRLNRFVSESNKWSQWYLCNLKTATREFSDIVVDRSQLAHRLKGRDPALIYCAAVGLCWPQCAITFQAGSPNDFSVVRIRKAHIAFCTCIYTVQSVGPHIER